MPSVYLADPDSVFRDSLADALRQGGADVMEFSSGSELSAWTVRGEPDLVVLASDSDEMEGCQVLARFNRQHGGMGFPFVLVIHKDRALEQIAGSIQGFLADWNRLCVRNLSGVLAWLQTRGKSGRFEVEAFGERGTILLSKGEVLEARWKELQGRDVVKFFAEEFPEQGFRFAERVDEMEARGTAVREAATEAPTGEGHVRTRQGPLWAAEVHFELARDLIERGRPDDALVHLRQAAESFARQVGEVHFLMGLAHLRRGEVAAAVDELWTSRRSLPEDIRVAAVLDEALERLARFRLSTNLGRLPSAGASDRLAPAVERPISDRPAAGASRPQTEPQLVEAAPPPPRDHPSVSRALQKHATATALEPQSVRVGRDGRGLRQRRSHPRAYTGIAAALATLMYLSTALAVLTHGPVPTAVAGFLKDLKIAGGEDVRSVSEIAQRRESSQSSRQRSAAKPSPTESRLGPVSAALPGQSLGNDLAAPATGQDATLQTVDASAEAAEDYSLQGLRGRPRVVDLDAPPRPRRLLSRNTRALINPRSGQLEMIQSWTDPIFPRSRAEMWVLVDASGRVEDVRVLRSSGYKELDGRATTAIRNVQYTPARRREAAVAAWVQQRVTFNVD